MSVIYKAEHELMQRGVAIKMLHSRYLQDAESNLRFQHEAQAASRLNHANVITVHDFGETEDGRHYLVMDFVDGDSLAEKLDDSGPMHWKAAIPIFIQVCEGLAHAHDNGIIHRDLKPGNIMLIQHEGRELVKVVDFGVAKMLPRKGKPMQQLTHTGEIFGTSLYLSPEQCAGKSLDKRSDVYAFGCVMHEVLTALPPFVGMNLLDTMQKHINEPVVPFSQSAPELKIPEAMEQIVAKALAKQPEDRYQDMNELKQDLLALEAASTTSEKPVVAPQPEPQAPAAPPPPANCRRVWQSVSSSALLAGPPHFTSAIKTLHRNRQRQCHQQRCPRFQRYLMRPGANIMKPDKKLTTLRNTTTRRNSSCWRWTSRKNLVRPTSAIC